MGHRSRLILTGCALAWISVCVFAAFAQPAETDDPTREIATTIRQTESRARTLKTQIDEVLRNLERPGAQARGSVVGWERLLKELRAEAAQAGQMLSWQGSATGAVAALKLADEKEVEGTRRRLRELDRRLQRLNETIARTERSLQQLQREMQEPDIPPAAEQATAPQPKTTPQAAEKVKKELDLSGTWLDGSKELSITHNVQTGAIVLQKPHTLPDGRFDEYRGTISGLTVTLSHPVTALTSTSKKVPAKVKQERAEKGLTSTLRLQLSPDGRRLEGEYQTHTVEYNAKTLKILKITPKTDSVVLTKKDSQPILVTPAKPTVEKKPGVKGPPEPEEEASDRPPPSREDLELLRRDAAMKKDFAVEWLRRAQEATRRVGEAPRRIEEAQARVRDAEERVRQYQAVLDRLHRPELEARRADLQGMENYLNGLRRQVRTRFERIVDERHAATGASREAIRKEMYETGEYRAADRLDEEIQQIHSQQDRAGEDDIDFFRMLLLYARDDFRVADLELLRAQQALREVERHEEALWDTYDEAQAAANRARRLAQDAARRARAAPRPSP